MGQRTVTYCDSCQKDIDGDRYTYELKSLVFREAVQYAEDETNKIHRVLCPACAGDLVGAIKRMNELEGQRRSQKGLAL